MKNESRTNNDLVSVPAQHVLKCRMAVPKQQEREHGCNLNIEVRVQALMFTVDYFIEESGGVDVKLERYDDMFSTCYVWQATYEDVQEAMFVGEMIYEQLERQASYDGYVPPILDEYDNAVWCDDTLRESPGRWVAVNAQSESAT